ncbi:pro-resilin isoform X2 [Halyomorpha halys]|uniref:pro-resilin isoform X2 n=1 Tax=Halyomorpha halys TaxID=286706 RepID=UPI0006D4ECC6|nr:pro-resilin-like isoform X2 [Halyomorpha halys]KAE8573579.1 Cuticle Protein CPR RR-2 [Halyomorpha halys]
MHPLVKIVACVWLVTLVSADAPSASYLPPSGGNGGNGYGRGGTGPSGGDGSEGPPQPFSFSYEVKDAESGNDYSHKADSDGQTVRGEYNVLLPDGRKQKVSYTADNQGYNADVQYEGEAKFGGPGGSGGSGGYPSGPSGGFPSGTGTGGTGGGNGYPSGPSRPGSSYLPPGK